MSPPLSSRLRSIMTLFLSIVWIKHSEFDLSVAKLLEYDYTQKTNWRVFLARKKFQFFLWCIKWAHSNIDLPTCWKSGAGVHVIGGEFSVEYWLCRYPFHRWWHNLSMRTDLLFIVKKLAENVVNFIKNIAVNFLSIN